MRAYQINLTHQESGVEKSIYVMPINDDQRQIPMGNSSFGVPKIGPAIIFCMRKSDNYITRIHKTTSLERELSKFKNSEFIYFYKKINSLKPWKYNWILESTAQYAHAA
jgi:hypothetical protein